MVRSVRRGGSIFRSLRLTIYPPRYFAVQDSALYSIGTNGHFLSRNGERVTLYSNIGRPDIDEVEKWLTRERKAAMA